MVTLGKILYPTDFSDTAAAAFETAQRLARDSNALLVIAHVVEPQAHAPGAVIPHVTMSGVSVQENVHRAVEEAREALQQIVPGDGGIRYEHRLLEGVPSEALPQLAEEENADLIVLGTHGRTGLRRLLMGSVAEAVVRHAKCPVLTLRPADGALPEAGGQAAQP
jgi:nucleotide-binding universal stress UspA family protein